MTLTAVFFWNTADTTELPRSGVADVYVAPKKTKLTKAERKEIVSIAQLFVEAAVGRDHPERAFDIVGPYIRGGLSREDWKTGNIPVVPFPVDAARWSIEYSNDESVGLRVMLLAERGSGRFRGGVRPASRRGERRASERRWRIDGWTPRGGGSTSSASGSDSPADAFAAAGFERASTRISTWWLLAPFALLAGGLVIPLVLWGREWRTTRRVRRAMG